MSNHKTPCQFYHNHFSPLDTSPLAFPQNMNNLMFGGTVENYRHPQTTPSPQPSLSPAPLYQTHHSQSTSPAGNILHDQLLGQNHQQNYYNQFQPVQDVNNLLIDGQTFNNLSPNNQNNLQQWNHQQQNDGTSLGAKVLHNLQPMTNLNGPTTFNSNIIGTNQLNQLNQINQNNLNNQNNQNAIASTNGIATPMNLSSLLDMDNHQMVLNSAELNGMLLNFNSEQYSDRLQTEEETMTDSFTRLTTSTIAELTDLNKNLYNDKK